MSEHGPCWHEYPARSQALQLQALQALRAATGPVPTGSLKHFASLCTSSLNRSIFQ